MPHSISLAASMNLENSIKVESHERYPVHLKCLRNIKKIKYPDFQAMTIIIIIRNGPPAWQQRLQKQIDQLRSDLSIINEYTTGNTSKKTKQKLKTIQKEHKITKEEQITTLKEDLKQNLQAKAQ